MAIDIKQLVAETGGQVGLDKGEVFRRADMTITTTETVTTPIMNRYKADDGIDDEGQIDFWKVVETGKNAGGDVVSRRTRFQELAPAWVPASVKSWMFTSLPETIVACAFLAVNVAAPTAYGRGKITVVLTTADGESIANAVTVTGDAIVSVSELGVDATAAAVSIVGDALSQPAIAAVNTAVDDVVVTV